MVFTVRLQEAALSSLSVISVIGQPFTFNGVINATSNGTGTSQKPWGYQNLKERQRKEQVSRQAGVCAVSRYKVINATLLAHIHLIAGVPEERHVSHKKSLRGEIMLGEQSGAHRGSMDSIQPLVFHIGWDT